jgi:hypothetical protein
MFTRANATGWTQGDKLTPSQINLIDVNQSRALDGVWGGNYALGAKLSLGGTGGLEIAGSGNAAWLMLSQRTQVIQHPLALASVVPNAGPFGNMQSAQFVASDLVSMVSGISVAPGCVASVPGATTQVQASYFVLELMRPPDGSNLLSVVLHTKGVSGGGSTNLPTYTLVRWTAGGALSACSGEVMDDHRLLGAPNWTTELRTQKIDVSSPVPIAIAQYRYGVLVKSPYGFGGASFRIYGVTGSYEVTSMRF